jgi:translocation and assembly module TamB
MKRASWLRRLLWITPLVLLLLAAGGLVALRIYLSSAAATRQVAEHLQDLLGGHVALQGAQISLLGDSSVRGIEAFAEGEQNKPWLRIDDATTDLSVLSVLRGQGPKEIHLKGARVVLRFDSDGHLLTKLPSGKKGAAPTTLPRLHLEGGELTFDQEHRAPMIIRGLKAEVVSTGNDMKLDGTITDPFWGDWKASGAFDSGAGNGHIVLDADKLAVTMRKLKSIAFVPPSVWDEIEVEGTTPAKLWLNLGSSGGTTSVSYRVEIAPRDARIKVPSIDLEAAHSHGKAVVADEIVDLNQLQGKTAGGSITASGKLNFHDAPSRLGLKVGVQDVVLHDLPSKWNVPNQIDGKLTGSADVVVTLKQGKVETEGAGEGVIRDAKVSGFAADKPIRLALRSNGKGFQFHQPEPGAAAPQPIQPRVEAAPQPIQPRAKIAPEPIQPRTAFSIRADEEPNPPADNDDFFQNAPAEVVNLLGRGIQMTADGLAKGIDAAANALGKLKPPSKPGEEPTYLDVDLSLQNVDLAQMVQKLKLNLPYAVTGRLTFKVHASIPVNTAGDLKAYRLSGTANLPTFNMAGLDMTNVAAKVTYRNGVLHLEDFSGQMPSGNDPKKAGKFDGKASVEVVPRGDVQSTLKLERIPLTTILNFVPQAKGSAAGVVSGDVQARAPLEKLSDPATWRGSSKLTSPSLTVYGVPLRNTSLDLTVDDTRARLSSFKAEVEGTPLTGEGELRLAGNYPFKGEVHTGRTDLTALHRLSPSFRPPFALKGRAQLDGTASGTLKPLQFDTKGAMKATDVVAEGFTVDKLSFGWSNDKNSIKLSDIKADLYGGTVNGTASVPLDAAATGTADLRVRALDIKALGKALPSFPVRLEGKVSGTVKGELAAAQGDRTRTWSSDVVLTAPQLRVQGIPAEKLKGRLDSRQGKATYNLEGETLGGTFTLKGDLPMGGKKKEEKKSNQPLGHNGPELQPVAALARQDDDTAGRGRFELHNALLSRVWNAYNITGALSNLNASFSLFLDYQLSGPSFTPSGNGSFRIVNIRWSDETFANSLQGEARLTADELQLYNIGGNVAGGQFLGSFVFGLKTNRRSHFRIDLQQVEAARLLLPVPAVAAHVSGPMDVNLRGRIGREWDGGGGATLARGLIYGMEVTEWRIPLTFSFSPAQGTGEVAVRDSHARLAQGRARFESQMHWGNGLRLTGRLLFYQVDLRTLLRSSPEAAAYASGRVSGRVDLAGSEMHSINDLTALVQAKMTQGQAMQLPVMRQIIPYLRPRAQSSTFQSGELKGRLAGGIFRIQRATLAGDFLKLLIQGTINLAGNLNLDVTAQSGLYCLNPNQTNSVRSRIPIIGAIPRLVLYEASSLLSAAVVHLRVTGTVHSPVVRLEPLLLMTEESIRFFLGRAVGLDIPNLP